MISIASSMLLIAMMGRMGPNISSCMVESPGVTSVIRVGLIFSFCSSASPPKTTFPRVELISDIRRLCHVCVCICVSVFMCVHVCVDFEHANVSVHRVTCNYTHITSLTPRPFPVSRFYLVPRLTQNVSC